MAASPSVVVEMVEGFILSPHKAGVVVKANGFTIPARPSKDVNTESTWLIDWVDLPLLIDLRPQPYPWAWHALLALAPRPGAGVIMSATLSAIEPHGHDPIPALNAVPARESLFPPPAAYTLTYRAWEAVPFELPDEFSDIVTTNPLSCHRWLVAADWARDRNRHEQAEQLEAAGRLIFELLAQNDRESR